MANKIFKGFRQVTEGNFEAQTGYIYFVRNSANTGATDGYLQFNGKKYGTAAEAKAELEALIGELPEGVSTVVDYVEGQLSAITDNFSSDTVTGASNGVEVHIGQADGNVTAVTVTAPDFDNTYAGKSDFEAVSGAVETIQSDYLTSENRTAIEGLITAETAAREAVSADTRLDALEGISADTRIANLEALSASTRLTGLEASAHTHENKTVLDGITAEKVQAWDALAEGAEIVISAYTGDNAGVTEGMLKSYEIFQGGVSKGKIDIPKDLVVSSGQIVEVEGVKYLRLTIANSSTPVDIAVTDLVDVYTPGNGIEISNSNEVSAKVVSGNGLTLDSNGIAMGLADGNNAGAMSAADFTKLGTIEASAQTNVIETVKVDGTALTVTDKAVDITLPDYTNTYAPIALTGTVADNKTTFDNYTAVTDGRLDELETSAATKTEVGTLSGRVNTLEAISADTRLDALEAISGDSHTHSNKAVLDGITDEKVADWDAAEQNAKDYADGLKNGLNADVSGGSNGVEVRVQQVSGVVTDVTVTAPDFDATYAPISLNSAATRLDTLEAVSADTRLDALEAVSADTRLGNLEAVSADTRLQALEALTGDTSSALQSISAADASVSVSAKANNNQTVGVALSADSDNALSLANDGLFAAIYYDGDDSD